MGLSLNAVALLLEEGAERPFRGTIGTLGKQRVFATNQQLSNTFRRAGAAPQTPLPRNDQIVTDTALLEAMGFDTVESLDYSDYEGATHVLDLNQPTIPDGLRERYDVLLDSGTIEHVFHIPNVLANIHNLIKVGGRVIFIAPSSNHLDHGFYMFSPTFFYDYYRANGFKIEAIYVVRYHPDGGPWHVYEYSPSAWEQFQIGGLDSRPYAIFLVATKTATSRHDVIPQQGFYADTSQHYAGSRLAARQDEPVAGMAASEQPALTQASIYPPRQQRLRAIARRVPGLRSALRAIAQLSFRLGINLHIGNRHSPYPRLRGRY